MLNTGKDLLSANGDVGTYPKSYYAATANRRIVADTIDSVEQADIAIIGGGLTGLSAAYHAAKAGYCVVVLEANRIAWGASGRNGGQMGTGLNAEVDELEKLVGKTRSRALWDLSVEAVSLCKQLIADEQIDCGLTPGIMHTNHRQRFDRHSQALVERLQQAYDYRDIAYLDSHAVRERLGTRAYAGGTLDKHSAHCHPLNFALGLAQAAQNQGVKLIENTKITAYETLSTNANQSVVLRTANQQTIKATSLLICCNGYQEGLNATISKKVMPINNFIIATEPLSDQLAQELIRDNTAVADSKFVVNYYRLSQDKRLLFGGGETYNYRFPKDIKGYVRRRMLQIYPQLADTAVEYGWGGTLAITMNRLPYFDQLSGNVLTASGYSGHGLAMATLAGKLLSEAVDGNLSRYDLMADLPSPNLPGGAVLRWPLLVLAMTYYSLKDRL